MGWYEQRIFNPFILEKALDVPEVNHARARLLAGAVGDILEIGLGTGLNLPSYPPAVTRVASVGPEEAPDARALARAAARGICDRPRVR